MGELPADRRTRRAAGNRDPRDRPVWRLWAVLTASDPGLERLRSAGRTVATLLVALGVLFGLVTAWGQPVTSAVLGVVVAMIGSIAVTDPTPGQRAGTLALMAVCAGASVSVAAALRPHPVVADAVFVVVAVAAVFLRQLGARGTPAGMVGFIAYFLALFLQLPVDRLPVAITSAAVGALVAFGTWILLRPRHPDRDLRRMLAALGVRAGSVVEVLGREVARGGPAFRETHRLRRRVAACGETALMIEQRLDSAEEELVPGIDNDELSVRVFDVELGVEHLVSVASEFQAAAPGAARAELVTTLVEAGAVLREGTGRRAVAGAGAFLGGPASPPGHSRSAGAADERDRLLLAVDDVIAAWLRAIDPQPEEAATRPGTPVTSDRPGDEGDEQDGDGGDDRSPTPWRETARQAVQVGVAAALAIVVGELLSPTRWFWAAIAAFVVFTGASTRGETLSKGWQRVIGTVAGVGAGVVAAELVGRTTAAALVLIVLCVFLAVYLMRISSAWMIFFLTTMLALLYELLGQFSVGLLVVRLEETAAGAGIGVLVSFLVFPNSTRGAVRSGAGDFLGDLAKFLAQLTTSLSGQSTGGRPPAEARALRESFDALRSTAKPLTDGLAGVANRSGYRRSLRVLGACEHHARALARSAETVAGAAADPGVRRALENAVQGVRSTVDTLARAADSGLDGVALHPADAALDALDRTAATAPDPERRGLLAASRHLRAIDQALRGLAADRGASTGAEQPVS